MDYKRIEVTLVSGALGAEVAGVNLAHAIGEDTFAEIAKAFLEHFVIFFRGQDITPAQQKALARRFGELDVHEYVEGLPKHPEVIAIVKEAENRGYNFGGRWHHDVTYQERPVVRTHPQSGRKCLFVNATYTTRFKDMTVEESAPLLEYLCRHATQESFTCRFRWEPGSIAFWDNRCVQHYALNDYHGRRREMHRVTISGDRPN